MRPLAFALLLCSASCARTATQCELPGDVSCVLDPNWQRRVEEPVAMSVITARGEIRALPHAVTFGSSAWGKTALYLRFPRLEVPPERIERAFLRLEPLPATARDAEPVDVEVWRVRRAWDPGGFDWRTQPTLGPPRTTASTTASMPLRVDVTELVRDAERHPERSHGLAVLSRGGDGHGVTFATGASGPWLPRLEVYVVPRER